MRRRCGNYELDYYSDIGLEDVFGTGLVVVCTATYVNFARPAAALSNHLTRSNVDSFQTCPPLLPFISLLQYHSSRYTEREDRECPKKSAKSKVSRIPNLSLETINFVYGAYERL